MEPDEFTEEELELAVQVLERIAERALPGGGHSRERTPRRRATSGTGSAGSPGTVLEPMIGRGRRGA